MTTTGTRADTEGSPDPSAPVRAAQTRALIWGVPRPDTKDKPRRSWREQVLIRANELTALATWMGSRGDDTSDETLRTANADLDAAARAHLQIARDAAIGTAGAHGARMERAVGHLDAAEALLLRRSPDDYLRGELPWLLAHVRAHLAPAHPQRVYVQDLTTARTDDDTAPITGAERNALVEAARAASWAERRESRRLRSFRTAVALTAVALLLLAAGIGVVGAVRPQWMPLCFAPQGENAIVCPIGTQSTGTGTATTAQIAEVTARTVHSADIAIVMLIGLAGAAVTGAAALRRLRGTSTPFAVPATLLVLKLPTGALTAFLGLILLHGNFVPGLSALDSSDQILAWALLFGAAQQLLTGLVDKKAQSVLDSVGSTPMTAEHE
ncbi:MAG: hypothetical protein ACXVF0_09375 [Blastococcus sp.]